MGSFPRDKDLPAGSTMAAMVLNAKQLETVSATRIGSSLKKLRAQHAESCDMVILCVAPGYGAPFVQGLMESIATDPTAVVDTNNESDNIDESK